MCFESFNMFVTKLKIPYKIQTLSSKFKNIKSVVHIPGLIVCLLGVYCCLLFISCLLVDKFSKPLKFSTNSACGFAQLSCSCPQFLTILTPTSTQLMSRDQWTPQINQKPGCRFCFSTSWNKILSPLTPTGTTELKATFKKYIVFVLCNDFHHVSNFKVRLIILKLYFVVHDDDDDDNWRWGKQIMLINFISTRQ